MRGFIDDLNEETIKAGEEFIEAFVRRCLKGNKKVHGYFLGVKK